MTESKTDTVGHLQGQVDGMQSYIDRGRYLGHAEVTKVLQAESGELMDQAFRARALGQESKGKVLEEQAKYLLTLISSLPTKLRAP